MRSTASAADVRLTYDDFLLFPDDGKRHELIDGVHYVTPSPRLRHQDLVGRLHGEIFLYLREHPEQTALVHLARLAHEPVRLPLAALDGIEKGSAAYGKGFSFEGDSVVLTARGPQVGVWTWQPVS